MTTPINVDDPWAGAACREPGVSATWFFPEPGGRGDVKRAMACCRRCPLRRPCLTYALSVEARLPKSSRHGIFAGTTPNERERIAERGAR